MDVKKRFLMLTISMVLALGIGGGVAYANDSGNSVESLRLATVSARLKTQTVESEPNNTMANATGISLNETVNGNITSTDDKDYYRFRLPSSGKVAITGTSYMQYTTYYVYDANGNEVWRSWWNQWNSTTKRQDLSWRVDLTSGTYYFCVARADSGYTGAYNFKLVQIRSINSASVSGIVAKTYTGKAITQSPVVKVGSTTLKSGTDYSIKYANNKNAGTASLTITGKGAYTGSLTRSFTINKAANTLTASAKAKTIAVKYSKLKKKNQTIAKSKAFKVGGNKGAVTFKKLSGNKKISVSKAGKITVKKGLKKSTYTVKVRVKAAGNGNYKPKSVNVALKIRVK